MAGLCSLMIRIQGKSFSAHTGHLKSAQIALAQSWAKECENTGPVVKIMTPPAMPTATRARFFPGEDRSCLNAPSDVAATLIARVSCQLVSVRTPKTCPKLSAPLCPRYGADILRATDAHFDNE